jgi:hypothetical protein
MNKPALFPTRLLTSEDEYKWYWHQMIYFPETIKIVSTRIYTSSMHSLLSSSWVHQLTLCMLASWSREGVVFLVLLPSSHLTMYHVLSLSLSGLNWRSLFPPLGTGSPFPQNGAPIHRVRAHSLPRVHDMPFPTYLLQQPNLQYVNPLKKPMYNFCSLIFPNQM